MTGGANRQELFSGTRTVPRAQSLDLANLEAYLAHHVSGFAGPLQIALFKGGQSNPTYFLRSPSAKYVLRRKPEGKLLPSAHAVEREYRVTHALQNVGFPVPRPMVLCEDINVVGTPFYVMDYVEGRIFWEPHAPGLTAGERHELFESLNETIASLHMIDYRRLGLESFGRPEGYVMRQVKRWSEQYRASQTRKVEAMDRLIEVLPSMVPRQTQSSLIHGDFRLDNCVVDPKRPRVIAVLDWELSTLGDPIADFTYQLMQWHMPTDISGGGVGSLVGKEGEAPGVPSVEAYVHSYCRRRNLQGIANLDLYLGYNFFRLAAIFQGIAGRVRDGTATNPHAELMAQQVEPMALKAWEFARKAGA
jgi:aminoglycoside phosphotransferase (APT) family kinase protein